jgi:hypothetical protein
MGNNLGDLAVNRMTITHLPTLPNIGLNNTYTIFEPEFPIAKNNLLKKLLGVSDCEGDLLIVRHPHNDLSCITDIE